ncbi:hypothetical protein C8R44DRAFT_887951 [Mycena epipterygia]|nr:hypothetical protein C8R44DRAFT_887951 [Mycena epipterygia]
MTSDAPSICPPFGPASNPTVSTSTKLPALGPQAGCGMLRKYDDIVVCRRASPNETPQTRSQRCIDYRGEAHHHREFFVRAVAAVQPFIDISEPMPYGPEYHWGTSPPSLSPILLNTSCKIVPRADSTEPTAPIARNELLDRIVANSLELTAEDFPSDFYPEGSFDPDDLDQGFYAVFRHLWTAPKSALCGLPAVCSGRVHGAVVVVPEMLGDTGAQARTMLSTAEWKPRARDGSFDCETLFTSIVKPPKILGMVFDGGTDDSQLALEPNSSSSSTVLLQRVSRLRSASKLYPYALAVILFLQSLLDIAACQPTHPFW